MNGTVIETGRHRSCSRERAEADAVDAGFSTAAHDNIGFAAANPGGPRNGFPDSGNGCS
jgi:hypothetical protein